MDDARVGLGPAKKYFGGVRGGKREEERGMEGVK